MAALTRDRLTRQPGRGNCYEFTPAQRRHIRRSYEQGTSLLNIGRQYGVQETPIRRCLVEEGVPIRPQSTPWHALDCQPADGQRSYRQHDPVTDPAEEYAFTRAALYPDRERQQWMYGIVLAWYRRQEERE